MTLRILVRSPTPQSRNSLLHPALLFPDLLLSLTTGITTTINLHGVWVTESLCAWSSLILDDFAAVHVFRFRVNAHHAVHHEAAILAEFVDCADCIDGLV